MTHPRFLHKEECVQRFAPQLGCDFKETLGQFYAPYNDQLYALIRNTAKDAHPGEPAFKSFGDDYKRRPCVEEGSRAAYDKLLEKYPQQTHC